MSVMFFLQVALKTTVLLALVWALLQILRQRSAALRHQIWSAALAAVLALPFLATILPAWHVPLGNSLFMETFLFRTEVQAKRAGDGKPATISRLAESQQGNIGLLTLLLTFGGVASLAQMLAGWMTVERMRRKATPVQMAEFASLAHELGIRQHVELRRSPECRMPITYGAWRQTILLPAAVLTWSDSRRRAVLLHELAHVQRRDSLSQLLARLTLALYWWHPLVWAAWREFLKEREQAADDVVLNLDANATDYAGHLLAIARSMYAADSLGWAAIAMARPSQLEGRLKAILDSRRNRKTPGRGVALAAFLGVFTMLAPWAALQARAEVGQAAVAGVQTNRAAAALLSQGKEALSQKNYAAAFNFFADALAADSSAVAEVKMWQAITQERQDNFESAAHFYQGALASASPDSSAAATIMDLYIPVLVKLHYEEEAKEMAVQSAKIRETLSTQAALAIHHDSDVHKIGGEIKAPILLSKIEPAYSEDARLAKYSGAALLVLEIGIDGKARNVTVIRGLGLGLDEQAVEAVRQWRFKPGTLNGQSVAVIANVEVNFKLL